MEKYLDVEFRYPWPCSLTAGSSSLETYNTTREIILENISNLLYSRVFAELMQKNLDLPSLSSRKSETYFIRLD